MLPFKLNGNDRQLKHILCLGAHSDDIEIGCGGALLRLLTENPEVTVTWVVFSSTPEREQEAKASAADFLSAVEKKQIIIHRFRDAFFPYDGPAIKEAFEALKAQPTPDLIFSHCRHDLHQDHRVICDLTWNTFRDHLIWEYEIPKYDGDLGTPNLYVHLDKATCERKAALLMQHFATQSNKHWFTPETFLGLMRLRGIESRSPLGYAEGFYSRKGIV